MSASDRRLPADWEPPAAIWLAWPHREATWPGRFAQIPSFFADLACTIAGTTPVRILVPDHLRRSAAETLRQSPKFASDAPIRWLPCPTNDCWIRDYGPVWVREGDAPTSPVAIDFRYNAWGGKYPPWDEDAAAAQAIAVHTGQRCESSPLCLEGGAINTDGTGRLLTTRSCLLTRSRNPGWTESSVAEELHRRLGITEIVWLGPEAEKGASDYPTVLLGDDTDGHIDQVARFVDSENVVVATTGADDANRPMLRMIRRQLELWADMTQPRVRVHELPIPPARSIQGQRLPESYCNFLRLGAERLLLPCFGDPPSDESARTILGGLLPGCQIEQVDCRDVVWGLGALHCLSLNEPRAC